MFPVFAKAREKARQSSCQSNIKQVMLAYLQYAQDYDEKTVFYAQRSGGTAANPYYQFYWLLDPYINNWQLWNCPSDNSLVDPNDADRYVDTGGVGIAYPDIANYGRGVGLGQIESPAETVVFADCVDGWLDTDNWGGVHIAPRHNDQANVGFFDGHVKSMQPTALRDDKFWPDF